MRQVLLYAEDFDAASAEIEKAGGSLLHVFSRRVFVAALPAEVDPRSLSRVSTNPPSDLDEIERLLAESWESLQQQQAATRFTAAAAAETILSWDTPGFQPPDPRIDQTERPMAAAMEPVPLSTGTPTSLYLTGKVAVGVVTVSGSPWTQRPGGLKWVSVGQDGTVWGVNASDNIFRWTGTTWTQIPGGLKQISVGNASNVWGVNANDEIFRWTGTTWQKMPGGLKNVSVGSDGTVWGVNSADNIFRWTGSTWTQIPGGLKQISVANANTIWGTNASDAIYRWTGSTWTQVSGGLSVVSAAFDGSVFGVNSAGNIYRYLGNNAWQQMPGGLMQISAASVSNIWGVNSAYNIYQGNSSSGLNFSLGEISKIVSEVQEGLNFLASAEPLARVTFYYDWRTINVSVTPGPDPNIANPYETMEAPWRNAALQAMGFPGSTQGSVDYVNSIKQQFNTDWAYVGYFTKYPLNWFAYQTTERVVMQYANDGWGPDAINQVFAHETGHVFGAADEYGGCGCGNSGYYNIPNGNCVNCTSSQVACLMSGNTLALCNFSRGQIGWSTWERMPGGLKWVSVGQDGTVWGVNSADNIFRWTGSTWTQIPGGLKQISVGNASNVWGVNANDEIFRWTGTTWQRIPGGLKNVSVAADGTVWGCNAADNIYRWTGSTWQQIPGGLICVAAASDGTVWGVNSANNIFRYNSAANTWTMTSGGLKEISVGSASQIWGVNAFDQIYSRRILATP